MRKGSPARFTDLPLRGDLALVAGLALVFGYLLARRGLVLGDEGYILLQSVEVARGAVLYRDLDSFVSPGIWLLHAALFSLFEPSVLASRMLAVLCFAGTTVFAYLLARRAASRAAGWLAVAGIAVFSLWSFPAWTFSFYSPYSILFVLAGADRFLVWNETRRSRDLFWCGVLLSIAIVFKQNYGMFAVFAILLSLFASRLSRPSESGEGSVIRDLAVLAVAAMAVAAPLLAYFALNGALGVFIDSVAFRPFQFAVQHDIAYPNPFTIVAPIWGNLVDWLTYGSALVSITNSPSWPRPVFWLLGSLHMFLYWLPPLLFVLGAGLLVASRKRAGRIDLPLLAVGLLAGFVYLGVFPRADYNHLLNVYQPIVVFGAVLAQRLQPRLAGLPERPRLFVQSGIGVVAAGYTLFALVGFVNILDKMTAEVGGRRGGVLVSPLEMGEIAYQVSWIRQNSAPSEPVLTIPDLAMLNFLAERPLPGAYYNMYQVHIGEDRGAGVARATEAERVRIVVARFHNFFSNKVGFLDYASELTRYIARTFRADEIVGNDRSLLMKRRERPLPVAEIVDVLDDCDVDTEVFEKHRVQEHVLFRTLIQNIGDGRFREPRTIVTRCRVSIPKDAMLAFAIRHPNPVRVRTGTNIDLEVNVIDAGNSTNLVERSLFLFPFEGWSKKAPATARLDLAQFGDRDVIIEFKATLDGRLWLHPWFGGGFSLHWQSPRIEAPKLAMKGRNEFSP